MFLRDIYNNSVCCFQAEKKVKELQQELDDLSQRLDEAGGATQAQVGSN